MYNERIVALLKRHKPLGAFGVQHLRKDRTGIGSVQMMPQRKHKAIVRKETDREWDWDYPF